MLDFITETNSVWQNMRSCGLPLVLYGMGNGADAVLDRMASEGLMAAGIFASDEFVRGQNFRGFKVEHYSDIKARLGNFAVVIAFASELPEVMGLSDRIIVMRARRIVGEISAEDATESTLLSMGMIGEVKEA